MKDNLKRCLLLWVLSIVSLAVWSQNIRMAVLLPLKEESNRGATLMDFYRGLLMAVERVKAEGVSVSVRTVDCGTSAAQMQETLKDGKLDQMDMIIGPLDGEQVPLLSDFCSQHRIRMILPFNTPCPQIHDNSYIYQLGIAQEQLFPEVAALVIHTFSNSRFIFCNTGDADSRTQNFCEYLERAVQTSNMQSIRFRVPTEDVDYASVLSPAQTNVIVLDSRNRETVERTLQGIKAFQQHSPQFKVALLGYPEWVRYAPSLQRDYNACDTYIYTTYFRNPLSGRVLTFEQQFQKNFNKRPVDSYPRAELLGYDLGYYFLHGLATLGTDFDERQGTLEQLPLQHKFNFQRVNEQGGFINHHTQLIHYAPNNTITVIQ